MKYEIRDKSFYVSYRHINWTCGEPYWITDATYAAPSEPIEKLHYHNMYETGICMEGSGEFQINEKLYRFKKGDMVFINRFTPHQSNSDNEHPAKWKMFFFDPAKALQHAGVIDPDTVSTVSSTDIPMSGVFSPSDYPILTDFIQKITDLTQTQDEYTGLSIAFAIGNFVISCIRYLKTHPCSDKQFLTKNSSYYKIFPAIDTITGHMSNSEMIKEDALAELCKMSVSNLRKLFKKHTGLSPKAYITNTRMAYAEYLLRSTNMTVLKIANEVGYNEISGFNRIFKATFRIPPSEYRKKANG